jgi:tRNA(Ile)-lysidine synthase
MEEKIYDFIIKNNLLETGDNCILGVSGGADSVCLLTVLYNLSVRLGVKLYVVHVNHMIRGEEAAGDEAYVKELCEAYGIDFFSYHIDVQSIASDRGLTVEEAGRMARYDSFREAAERLALTDYKIAVAHNKNDVCETVLLNLVRGTGMSGMKGITRQRDNIIRPLIDTDREEIENYLREKGISYCTDSTNLSTDYTRNKIRHKVMPQLVNINERAVSHINRFADIAENYFSYVNEVVEGFLEENVTETLKLSGARVLELDIDKLAGQQELIKDLVIMELIGKVCGGRKDIGGAHLNEVKKLFTTVSGSEIMLPHGARAVNSYGKLQFLYPVQNESYNIEITGPGIYSVPGQKWKLKVDIYDKPVNIDLTKKEYTKLIDYDRIQDGICLRNYMENDYIVINSEGSRKKISRLFSNCKISKEDRPYIPLIASESEVIWAIGIRIGENYKVSETTKKVVSFEYITE